MDKFINSAISTSIAEIVTQPICLIRTRIINGNDKFLIEIIKNLYKDQGILGFFKASPPAVATQTISTALKYSIYNKFQRDKIYEKMFVGSCGGMFAATITNPLEVIKINIQMGIISILNKPLNFFYQGYKKSLFKSCIGGALFFPLNDLFKDQFKNQIISSGLSAFVAVTILQPIDYLKTREMFGKSFDYKDLKIMYTGYGLNLMRVIPHFIIVMTMADYLQKMKK